MGRRLPIFYSALLLTGVNLLLRMVGTSFQVYLSARIGAAGIGLLQLVMSVGSLTMVAGIAGIRTATMYLTAEEIGRGKQKNVAQILSACFLYSILCAGGIGIGLYAAAPHIAAHWIGDVRTVGALRLLAGFLPSVCLCAVMTGYFTAANRIGTLAAVEVGEQLCAMAITLGLLRVWAEDDPAKACLCVVLGSSLGNFFTLGCLILLRTAEPRGIPEPIPVRSRLLRTAVPLALADVLRAGIGTAEHLLVPRRLALFPGTEMPLAAFGTVSGMVFPVLMFPACILFALAELLIPELARCAAAGRRKRITYLVYRGLRVAMLYGLAFAGLIFLLAQPLCLKLYSSPEAGRQLRLYCIMVPFLYCDAITDAMTKGLGQQKTCVRYNILTSLLDVVMLFFLLPLYGMQGYFLSFLISHLLNFCLSLRRLCRITGFRIPFHIPALAAAGVLLSLQVVCRLPPIAGAVLYLPALGSLLYIFRVVSVEDLRWAVGLLRRSQQAAPV